MSTELADDALEAVPGLSLTRTTTRGFKFDESVQSFWKAVEQDKWVLAATHFDKIRRHSVPPADAYNKMLEHTARWLPIESTLQMFNDMRTSGVQPDLNTYKIMIGALGARRELNSVTKLVDEMKERSLDPSDAVVNELIIAYVKSQRIDLALAEYDRLVAEKRQVEPRVYTELIELLAQKGVIERAFEIFHQCRAADSHGVPNRLYPIMLSLYIKRNKGPQALQLFGEMRQRFAPSETQTFEVLKLLSRSGMVKEAMEVFEAMKFSSLPRPDIAAYGEIIYMFCRTGEAEKANAVLEDMKRSDLVPRPSDYEIVLDSLLRDGIVLPAYDLLLEMHKGGIKPNLTRFCTLIKALAKESDVHRCTVMDTLAKQMGLQYDKGTYTALISCAARKRDITVCITHINDCAAVHGHSANWYNAALGELAHLAKQETALLLLAEMQKAGVEPNDVTYKLFITLGDVVALRSKTPTKAEKDKHWWIPPLPSPFAAPTSPHAAYGSFGAARGGGNGQQSATDEYGSLTPVYPPEGDATATATPTPTPQR